MWDSWIARRCINAHREIRCRMCSQARQTAADLRWKEDERYETEEKERSREGRPVPSSRTELTERCTAVYSCKAFTWESEQELLLHMLPSLCILGILENSDRDMKRLEICECSVFTANLWTFESLRYLFNLKVKQFGYYDASSVFADFCLKNKSIIFNYLLKY